MAAEDREAIEREIRSCHQQGDAGRAVEVALKSYGPEIYGFLMAFHRAETDADEVFSIFAERLWTGLPTFAWDCSFRTWAYTIARNAAKNYRDQLRVRARAHVALPDGSISFAGITAQVRAETAEYLKSQTKDRIARLRESLSNDEQMLLSLRLDRGLAWNELARVLHDGPQEELTAEVLKRESSRLRKRFQSVKEKLAALAREQGLLGDS